MNEKVVGLLWSVAEVIALGVIGGIAKSAGDVIGERLFKNIS